MTSEVVSNGRPLRLFDIIKYPGSSIGQSAAPKNTVLDPHALGVAAITVTSFTAEAAGSSPAPDFTISFHKVSERGVS